MKRLWLLLVLSTLTAGCKQQPPPAPAPAPAPAAAPAAAVEVAAPADVAAGRALAERACKGCHGLDAAAAPGMPVLAGQREPYLIAALRLFRQGKRSHGAGTEAATAAAEPELRNVAAFYAGLPPAARTAAHAGSKRDDAASLAGACAKCHGDRGNADKPGIPSLAGQQRYYLVAAMHEYVNGVRTAPAMKAIPKLEDAELERLATYFAAQAPVRRASPGTGDADAGRALSGACSGCHGVYGVSRDSSIPNLAGQDAQYLRHAIDVHRRTRQWGMEGYVAGLTDRDAANLAAFYAAQTPEAAEKGMPSAQAMAPQCDRCHDAGDGGPVAAPRIRAQDATYLALSLRAFRDGRREGSAMHPMTASLGNVAIDELAAWYAMQPAR